MRQTCGYLMAMLGIVGCAGCGGSSKGQQGVAPQIGAFAAAPASLPTGTASNVVWTWSYSNTPSPMPATCTIDHSVGTLVSGASTIVTLTSDTTFTLTCSNGAGRDNSYATITVSTPTPPTLRVAGVTVGGDHACALTNAGGVRCWGHNHHGQVGDGSTDDRLSAVDVSGLTSGVAAIALGSSHTCALTTVGGVKCWGYNDSGQLGDGTINESHTPVAVGGLAVGVTTIGLGGFHSCAVASGGVKCWGANNYGQLGDGSTTERHTAVTVTGLAADATAVAGGADHTCALTSGGAVRCWGQDWWGQLGDAAAGEESTPVDVIGLYTGVTAIAVGANHSCALVGDGVKCWGWNNDGQVGDGTSQDRTTPVDVGGLTSGVDAIAAGDGHTCALTSGGGVQCWGGNATGQLGDGTTTNELTPVQVSGLSSGMSAIAAGGSETCALTDNDTVACWGANDWGELGDGTTADRSTPAPVSGLPTP